MRDELTNQTLSSNLLTRITISPQICHGKPCIRQLRYPVDMILELLSSDMTAEEILADYGDLEQDDIDAVFAFAARQDGSASTENSLQE